ncbi:flagellar hook-length control protein FliK [Ferdinandcohnia sp. Marseille-Q9671]
MVANLGTTVSPNKTGAPTIIGKVTPGVKEDSFREKLQSMIMSSSTFSTLNTDIKLPHVLRSDNEEVEQLQQESVEMLNQFLAEMEAFVRDEVDISDFDEILYMLPPELTEQIKAFLTGIINGTNDLKIEQVTANPERIGLLLLTTRFVEEETHSNKVDLLNVFKQLKADVTETLQANANTQESKQIVQTDYRSNKLINDLIQNIENKLTVSEKPQIDLTARTHYLQTVHARYFTTPKGIDSKESLITERLLQKASNTTQVSSIASEGLIASDIGNNQLPKVQQFSLFIEQGAKQLPDQQQFIRQFQNILARSSFMNGAGGQKLLLNLYPEHLGSLRIELLQSESGMIARIMATTSQAKELIESQLTNLKHSFLSQNITVEKIEVSSQLQYQTEESNLYKDSEQQKRQPDQGKKENEQHETNEEQSFFSFLDELVNIKV